MSESNHESLPLTNEQRVRLNAARVTLEVSPYEATIIKEMRKVNYGQFTIHFHNGIPIRYTLGASYATDPTKDEDLLKEVIKNGNAL